MDPDMRAGTSDHSSSLFVVEQQRLGRAGNGQFFQVVHEDLQADIISEDRRSGLLSPGVEVVVGL